MLPSRLIWPAGILLAATLWSVLTAILDTGEAANGIAFERQRQQLAAAVERDLSGKLDGIVDVVMRQVLDEDHHEPTGLRVDRVLQRLLGTGRVDLAFIVNKDWTPVQGASRLRSDGREIAPDLKEKLGPITAEILRHVGTVPPATAIESARVMRLAAWRGLHEFGGRLYAGFVVPIPLPATELAGPADQPPETLLLFARKSLAPTELGRMAEALGLRDMRLRLRSEGGPLAARMPIPGDLGQGAYELTWSSERPGDLMRERLIPLTIAGFLIICLLFAAVVGFLLWQSRHLALAEARSRLLVGRDPLSGLPNRLLFNETLDRELSRVSRQTREFGLAVLFIDLDRFKDVNDTFGHKAGDHLIKLVAKRLLEVLRTTDTLARLGGDEFAIIQVDVSTPEDAAVLACRLLEALMTPFKLDAGEVIIGASIGIALAPQNGNVREALMGLADTALYQAKAEGRNRFSFFQSRMGDTLAMRKTVEEDLRHAIAEDRLVLHYQPIVSADGLKILALEALVRWQHPTKGLISPAEFIPIAEERGLIIPLGDWVMRRACQDGSRWPGLRMAVNVSPIQFRQRDFVPRLEAILEETGFDPHRLELEITEGVVVEDADSAESAMRELHELGIHLALDDFGTGYSSLIYLRRFAFDTIKIDRSFLESMDSADDSAILVHSMVHLGRALGLTVTAEGVESSEHHRFLQALGCHQLQGYLFHKPMPADRIEALLAEGRAESAA